MNLSMREKILAFCAFLAFVFFIYWYGAINPLLRRIDKTRVDINVTQIQLKQLKQGMGITPEKKTWIEKIEIHPREKQLSHILNFLDEKFKQFNIELISLQQSSVENKLTLDLAFESTYYKLLGFLGTLPELKTILVVENATVEQKERKLIVGMKIISGYL